MDDNRVLKSYNKTEVRDDDQRYKHALVSSSNIQFSLPIPPYDANPYLPLPQTKLRSSSPPPNASSILSATAEIPHNNNRQPPPSYPIIQEKEKTHGMNTMLQIVESKDAALGAERLTNIYKDREILGLQKRLQAYEKAVDKLQKDSETGKQSAAAVATKLAEEASTKIMEQALLRQGVSLLGFAGRHLENKDLETHQLLLDLKKCDKIIATLRDQLREKSEMVSDLKNEIDILNEFKLGVQLSNQVTRQVEETHAHAKVALNAAELESLRYRNDGLERRFNEMEELLQQKDMELRSLQRQGRERGEEITRLNREFQALQFEFSLKNTYIMELEKDCANKEELFSKQMREVEENRHEQLRQLEEKQEYESAKVYDHVTELERKHCVLEQRLEEFRQKNFELENLLSIVKKEKEDLQSKVVELEALAVVSDQTLELENAHKRESEYRIKLENLNANIRSLERESILLQKVRSENVTLSQEISRLSLLLARQSVYPSGTNGIYQTEFSKIPPVSVFPTPIERRQVMTTPIVEDTKSEPSNHYLKNRNFVDKEDWSNANKWTLSPVSTKDSFGNKTPFK